MRWTRYRAGAALAVAAVLVPAVLTATPAAAAGSVPSTVTVTTSATTTPSLPCAVTMASVTATRPETCGTDTHSLKFTVR